MILRVFALLAAIPFAPLPARAQDAPRAAISRLEVNREHRPPPRWPPLGAAATGPVGITVDPIAPVGGGTFLGAAIGSLVRVAQFRSVSLAPEFTASLALSRRAAALRFTLRL